MLARSLLTLLTLAAKGVRTQDTVDYSTPTSPIDSAAGSITMTIIVGDTSTATTTGEDSTATTFELYTATTTADDTAAIPPTDTTVAQPSCTATLGTITTQPWSLADRAQVLADYTSYLHNMAQGKASVVCGTQFIYPDTPDPQVGIQASDPSRPDGDSVGLTGPLPGFNFECYRVDTSAAVASNAKYLVRALDTPYNWNFKAASGYRAVVHQPADDLYTTALVFEPIPANGDASFAVIA
ncbi:hypothetical protein IWQ60_001966 [Tieghemiomyces parasiticus]|uniref:Uncharacterized protein n=1 Tax=Tieghemiomyces parasiticus TaxID=78921 RepID=A0A9W8ADL8_9FUNG|nr:hypothetical protein IWQ60_001966 [Tieghemiomyces parasiticus]